MGRGGAAPVRIVQLPADARVAPPRPRRSGGGHTDLRLPIGPGGDEGRVLEVDLLRTGGLLVTGPPGSGRTGALAFLGRHLTAPGVPVLWLGHPAAGAATGTAAEWRAPDDTAGVSAWVAGLEGRPGVVIADDVGTPAEWPALAVLPPLGAATGVALIAASSSGAVAGHYQGPVVALRRSRAGLLLCPGPGDGEVLGVRLPRTPLPVRPGSGWLVSGAGIERVQVARTARSDDGSADRSHRRSIAGPISCVAYQASS